MKLIEETRIKWNTDKPKFEDIKGKNLIIRRNMMNPSFSNIEKPSEYLSAFDSFKDYAILTDELVYCEYRKDEVGFGWSVTGCGHRVRYSDTMEWKSCPFCTNPIRTIEEIKPMELMDRLPEIFSSDKPIPFWFYRWSMNKTTVVSDGYIDRIGCINGWNEFVERMKK